MPARGRSSSGLSLDTDYLLFGKNRLYLLFNSDQKPHAAAVDTDDGRIVYQGEVTADASDGGGLGKLQLYNLDVKE